MILFGYVENIKGVSFPLIKTEFDISYDQQGLMVSLMSLSYVVFCLVGGILLGIIGVKKTFTFSFVFMLAGLVAVFFMLRFWSVTWALFFVFAGFGLFEVSSHALAAQIFRFRAALLMSLLHFFYGLGSSLSPRAAGILASTLSWRHVYLLSIPLVLLFLIPSLLARFPGTELPGNELRENEQAENKAAAGTRETAEPAAKKISFFTALKIPMVWIFSITLGLMGAVELSSPNWAGLYFQDVYGFDPKTSGAAFISNFYILFTASRLLSGFVNDKIGYMRCLFIVAIGTVFVFVLGFALGEIGIFILPALGFFTAVFWPTLLVTAIGYFREDAPIITSAIIVIAGALISGIQLLIGLTNRFVGPAWGYRSCLFYAILIIAALVVLSRYMRRPYRSAPA